MPPGVIISTLVPISIFAMVFGISYLKSRENMAMIERGINPKKKYAQPRPYANLKYGMLFTGAGLGLLLAYIIDELILKHGVITTHTVNVNVYSTDSVDTHAPVIYIALVAIGGGIGLILSYRIEKREWLDKQQKLITEPDGE